MKRYSINSKKYHHMEKKSNAFDEKREKRVSLFIFAEWIFSRWAKRRFGKI